MQNKTSLFDHLIGLNHDLWRNGQPKISGGMEIYDKLELLRLGNRQIAWCGTFQDFVDVLSRSTKQIGEIYAIGQETSGVRVLAPAGDGWHFPLRCERGNLAALEVEKVVAQDQDCARSFGHGGIEGLRELPGVLNFQDLNRDGG